MLGMQQKVPVHTQREPDVRFVFGVGGKASPMTAAEFSRIGQQIFGECWKGRMAKHLGVTKRVVQRWAADSMAIPEGAAADVFKLAFGSGGPGRASNPVAGATGVGFGK